MLCYAMLFMLWFGGRIYFMSMNYFCDIFFLKCHPILCTDPLVDKQTNINLLSQNPPYNFILGNQIIVREGISGKIALPQDSSKTFEQTLNFHNLVA